MLLNDHLNAIEYPVAETTGLAVTYPSFGSKKEPQDAKRDACVLNRLNNRKTRHSPFFPSSS